MPNPRLSQAPTKSSLKLLVAGVDSDTRSLVESAVRHALGSRAVSDPWTVSLVRIGDKWSVTLDGPEPRFRNLSFTTAQDRLSAAIREAIGAPGNAAANTATGSPATSGPSPAAAPPAGGEARARHTCESCGLAFSVVYESRPNEGTVMAAVACPHCWEINHLEIGAWAAAGKDFRAERA